MGCGSFLLVTICCLWLHGVALKTDPSEVNALQAIKSSLLDPMTSLSNWGKGDPCKSNWTGVICFKGPLGGHLHIQELQLLKRNLSGELAPEVGQLSYLKILDLMWNNFTGHIPSEIGHISSLELLLLNGNKFNGTLPPALGNLQNLTRLQVDENSISGSIPSSFGNLTSVKHLHLNNNTISGEIPVELSKLRKLIHLILDNNNLTGNLPQELARLPALTILQLDNNNFNSAEIPEAYGNFSRLVKLSMRNCSLKGPIPDFRRIQNFSYVDLSSNSLTGPIPKSKLSENMTTIKLSYNNLTGPIPPSFSELHSLQLLSLENNSLSGSVPSIWQNEPFDNNKLLIDLGNNNLSFSDTTGDLVIPLNVTLWLGGNPLCMNSTLPSIKNSCGISDEKKEKYSNSETDCRNQPCSFENVQVSPDRCLCAAPLLVEYRLKSPSFSYFIPYTAQFKEYITRSLQLEAHQLLVGPFNWEKGPRLRMQLKLFPNERFFTTNEVLRLRGIFTSWKFDGSNLFGPYELLGFDLGHYSYIDHPSPAGGTTAAELAGIVAGSVVLTIVLSVSATLLYVRKHHEKPRLLSQRRFFSTISREIKGVRKFIYIELVEATDNFDGSRLIGKGGYGKVYKGILPNKTEVAIKRAEENSLQGEREFMNEIELLSRLHHRNLVSLLGFCDENGEQMLVYEFMPNGNVRDWLSARGEETMSFSMRLRVALDSAKGIMYLHNEADPPVIHRDIKTSNILLDGKLRGKVSDFGLSRLAPALEDGEAHVSTVVRGTPGYVDPEYLMTQQLTMKSDVYSLGVVFLELLTGMHPFSGGNHIIREVRRAVGSGRVLSVADGRMGELPAEEVNEFFQVALRCCEEQPEKRPSISQVVSQLQFICKAYPPYSSYASHTLPSSSSSSFLLGSGLDSAVFSAVNPR